jgi:50S ribosomal subunit-associated GTPase HflX
VDTSVDMDVTADIRTSDLVLLVYDVSDPETIERIDTDWLPKINLINSKVEIL